ncbi:uncharacterized protein LOC141588524 [Silene latifolia]|uniref:uncharacterized protein LOC141588524 n=1 Tax=Silene latifolia TaxID=37657 RepID=UPI003D772482
MSFMISEVQSLNGRVVRNGRCLNERHHAILLAPISDDEVKAAMYDIPVYKCLSKVICSRLKKILPDITSPSQSAFVAGHDIVGNILICQDLIKLYKRKKCSPMILMKLDLQKAYDSVEWSFVHDMFIKGERRSIELMLSACEHFSKVSRLTINKTKSTFYCNGVDEMLINSVEMAMGMNRGKVPFKYLGVNVSSKRLSVLDCACLVEKMDDRIRGIGSRHLSYVGRIVLIKSIFSTLHNYWARIFILPRTVFKNIEVMWRDYLWHGKEIKGSPALVDWEKICRPKRQGGLGITDLVTWNTAALGKYVWWVEKKADHLWVNWVHAIYIKGKD